MGNFLNSVLLEGCLAPDFYIDTDGGGSFELRGNTELLKGVKNGAKIRIVGKLRGGSSAAFIDLEHAEAYRG